MSIDVNYQCFAHISQESWRRCFNWNIYCLTEKWLLGYSPKTSTQRYEKWQMHFPNAFKLFILLRIYSHFLLVSKDLRTSRLGEIDVCSRVWYNWTLALIELSWVSHAVFFTGKITRTIFELFRSLLILRRCIFGKHEKTRTLLWVLLPFSWEQTVPRH